MLVCWNCVTLDFDFFHMLKGQWSEARLPGVRYISGQSSTFGSCPLFGIGKLWTQLWKILFDKKLCELENVNKYTFIKFDKT